MFEFPVSVIEGTNLPSLQPSLDAVVMKLVATNSLGNIAVLLDDEMIFVRGGW